jgi:Arc/MetJ-type ribon-helix-helix transcriptional regulator
MNIRLTPEQEQLINDQLQSGQFHSAEEVVAKALATLCERSNTAPATNSDQEKAVSDMLAFVEKNRTSLQGISVKQLIHEGHRL